MVNTMLFLFLTPQFRLTLSFVIHLHLSDFWVDTFMVIYLPFLFWHHISPCVLVRFPSGLNTPQSFSLSVLVLRTTKPWLPFALWGYVGTRMRILGEHTSNYSSFARGFISFIIHYLPSIINRSPNDILFLSHRNTLSLEFHIYPFRTPNEKFAFVPRVVWLVSIHLILLFRPNHTVIPCLRLLTCGLCHLSSMVQIPFLIWIV